MALWWCKIFKVYWIWELLFKYFVSWFDFSEQVLHLWLECLCSCEGIIEKWYHPWSFLRSPGWVQIKCELRVLSRFAFNLSQDWEIPIKKANPRVGVRNIFNWNFLIAVDPGWLEWGGGGAQGNTFLAECINISAKCASFILNVSLSNVWDLKLIKFIKSIFLFINESFKSFVYFVCTHRDQPHWKIASKTCSLSTTSSVGTSDL